jgi:hypothetical protein
VRALDPGVQINGKQVKVYAISIRRGSESHQVSRGSSGGAFKPTRAKSPGFTPV